MVDTNGINNLRSAVMEQAIQDYINAKLRMEKSFDELQELQDFFTGDQYELYNETDLGGEDIMKHCDAIVEKKLKNWRKRRQKEMAV